MKHDAQTPKRAAYEALRRSILLMELAPGAPLDEGELAGRFVISRTPMREVIRQLAGEGYVTLVENRGAQVSDMSHRTLRDFFLTAPMIYGSVLRMAAECATLAQLEELKAAQAEVRRALDEGDALARTMANDSFHRITGKMCGNVFLLPSFHRLLIDHTRIGMTFFRSRDAARHRVLETAADQHDEMIAAIEAGDGERAAALAADHWALSRGQIETFVMPSGLDGELAQPASQKL